MTLSTETGLEPERRTTRVRELNDTLRTTGEGGRFVITAGVAAHGSLPAALEALVAFSAFTADNDPYGERDCATFEVNGQTFIWKIDYYDLDLTTALAVPSTPGENPKIPTRDTDRCH